MVSKTRQQKITGQVRRERQRHERWVRLAAGVVEKLVDENIALIKRNKALVEEVAGLKEEIVAVKGKRK